MSRHVPSITIVNNLLNVLALTLIQHFDDVYITTNDTHSKIVWASLTRKKHGLWTQVQCKNGGMSFIHNSNPRTLSDLRTFLMADFESYRQ